MKECVFWLFQFFAVFGVVSIVFNLYDESQLQPAFSAKEGSVLAASQVIFPHEDPSLPNPNTVLLLVNRSREASGLKPLIADESLSRIAQQRANDMYTNSYYAHKSPITEKTFVDDLRASQITYEFACENLSLEFVPTEQKYVQSWLTSTTGHRECLLDKEIARAGYAVAEIDLSNGQASSGRAYVIVAVHTTEPN